MWNPFKKRLPIPEFKLIDEFVHRDKYPARIKSWDWLSETQIFIPNKDENGKVSMVTMDFWLQEIFLDSIGTQSVKEIFAKMIRQYLDSKMEVPKNLDEILIETLETLENECGFIELREKPERIDGKILNPISG